MEVFLNELARSVNRLEQSGAYHADLSGKNIFTKDGKVFYFIDLDDVLLGAPSSAESRLKNHIQLYDSFCDFVPESILRAFIAGMAAPATDFDAWFRRVQEGQKIRRARHLR